MNKYLGQIGIKSELFKLHIVEDLMKEGVLEKPLDGNHGELHPKGEDFVSSGIPFIMAADISNGRIDFVNCKHITKKQGDSLRKGFAKHGDVLLTHKATIGRTAIVNTNDFPYIMLTPQVTYYRVKNPKKINNSYLRYFFESDFFQKTLNLWAGSGSTRAYLGITEQQKLPIILPPLPTQKKIAAVLSAYDDLIENNNRRIAILEKMAEEIYREWFVRMRFPGYEKVKFHKGIPEGWGGGNVGMLYKVKSGYAFKSDELNTNGYPVIKIRNINDHGVNIANCEKYSGSLTSRILKFELFNGDLLIAMTGAQIGKNALFFKDHNRYFLNQRVGKFFPINNKLINNMYMFFTARSINFQGQVLNYALGAAQPNISGEQIEKIEILIPDLEILQEFAEICSPMLRNILCLKKKNLLLEATKSLLLSRLISGKLSVENLGIKFPQSMEAVDG